MKLKLSSDLSLPLEAVTQTFGIIAVRGAGKTYTASVLAEELLKANLQTVVVDPTGAWWGLRSSADGKSAGYPVIVMGGNHGDVPLEEGAGEVVADFVVENRVSVILDLCLMSKAGQLRFMLAFATHLYHRKGPSQFRDPLHLILDEADRFAPQKPLHGTERLLGAIEDIVRLGRVRGFGITMVTQRAAVLNKNVLTQIETLVVLRTTSPQDRKAIDAWVEANATIEERDDVSNSLSSLDNGQAWFWSPGWLKVLKLVKVRLRETFNSSATPKVGEKRVEPKKLADVDLTALKGQIAATIEKAKENDPAALKKKIMALEGKVKMAMATAPKIESKTQRIEVPVLKDGQLRRIEATVCRLEKMHPGLLSALAEVAKAVNRLKVPSKTGPMFAPPAIARPAAPPPAKESPGPFDLTPARQRILNALAWLEGIGIMQADRAQLAFLADQSPTSSGYKNNLGALRSATLIQYLADGRVLLTETGRAGADPGKAPSTSAELHQQVLGKLPPARQRIFQAVIEAYPSGLTRADLAQQAGQSPTSSGYKNNLGALRSLGIITYPDKDIVQAASIMFVGNHQEVN